MTAKRQPEQRIELVYGTLDMLILRTLRWGPAHGHGIAKAIERMSDETLKVEHGSLYPSGMGGLQDESAREILPADGRGTPPTYRRNVTLGALCPRYSRGAAACP